MKKIIPDIIEFKSLINDKGMKYKDHYIIDVFDFVPSPEYVKRTTRFFDQLLNKADPEFILPSKNLAVSMAEVSTLRLAKHFKLDEKYLKEWALRLHIFNYLHSAVFNLRTIESIRRPMIKATAQILQFWEELPDCDNVL